MLFSTFPTFLRITMITKSCSKRQTRPLRSFLRNRPTNRFSLNRDIQRERGKVLDNHAKILRSRKLLDLIKNNQQPQLVFSLWLHCRYLTTEFRSLPAEYFPQH